MSEAAASSSVMLIPLESVVPPASDRITNFAPVGLTSRISISSGRLKLMLLRLTRIFETGSVTPETEIVDGYGEPGVGGVWVVDGSLSEIADGFEKVSTAAWSESRLLPKTKP